MNNEMSVKDSVFVLIFMFAVYLISRSPFFLLSFFYMVPITMRSIFRTKNYSYKLYYPIIFVIILIQWLILFYIYLYKSLYLLDLPNYLIFYLAIGGNIASAIIFMYYYPHRQELK